MMSSANSKYAKIPLLALIMALSTQALAWNENGGQNGWSQSDAENILMGNRPSNPMMGGYPNPNQGRNMGNMGNMGSMGRGGQGQNMGNMGSMGNGNNPISNYQPSNSQPPRGGASFGGPGNQQGNRGSRPNNGWGTMDDNDERLRSRQIHPSNYTERGPGRFQGGQGSYDPSLAGFPKDPRYNPNSYRQGNRKQGPVNNMGGYPRNGARNAQGMNGGGMNMAPRNQGQQPPMPGYAPRNRPPVVEYQSTPSPSRGQNAYRIDPRFDEADEDELTEFIRELREKKGVVGEVVTNDGSGSIVVQQEDDDDGFSRPDPRFTMQAPGNRDGGWSQRQPGYPATRNVPGQNNWQGGNPYAMQSNNYVNNTAFPVGGSESPLYNTNQGPQGKRVGWTKIHKLRLDSPFGEENSVQGPIVLAKSAMIADLKNGQIIYQKNAYDQRPIASISKLMSAIVFLDSNPNLNEKVTITNEDEDYIKFTGSRLVVGTTLTKDSLLHIGLMSSENRAIHALARTYPGGMKAFIKAMNAKAHRLGMTDSVFYDPTGLDKRNMSTAADLVKLVDAAYGYPLIRKYSTMNEGSIIDGRGKVQQYRNSNKIVREGFDVSLQKTGYIREAGRCMVVRTSVGGDPYIVVILNAPHSAGRFSDFVKMQGWISDKRTKDRRLFGSN